MRTVRSTPFVRATAVAVAVAAWLPLGSWAADPTPDPAEPSVVATSTVTKASADGSPRRAAGAGRQPPRDSSVNSGRGASLRLPSGSVTWHSMKMRAVQAAHLAASSFW